MKTTRRQFLGAASVGAAASRAQCSIFWKFASLFQRSGVTRSPAIRNEFDAPGKNRSDRHQKTGQKPESYHSELVAVV
jgi:hypothetical protein